MFTLDLQRFGGKKGSTQTTQANVPAATEEEKQLLQEQLKWTQATRPVAEQLLTMASGALTGQQVVPDPSWQDLYNSAQAQTTKANSLVEGLIPQAQAQTANNADANAAYSGMLGSSMEQMNEGNKHLMQSYDVAMKDNVSRMNDLWSGNLPSSYAAARQQALQSDLDRTVGHTLSGLAGRGIINSSQADSAFNDISRNAANTLAGQFSNDMQVASGLANQAYQSQLAGINGQAGLWDSQYRNQLAGIGQGTDMANQSYNNGVQGISTLSQLANQYQQMGMAPIGTAATAQEAATNQPMQYLAMATGQNAPTANLLQQMSNQRYSVATPGQTVVRQGSGGFFGGLMSGLGGYLACFTKNTAVATPQGAVLITELQPGDEVVAFGAMERVTEVKEMGEQPIIELVAGRFTVETTATQTVFTPDGSKPIRDVMPGGEILTVDGWTSVDSKQDTGRIEPVYELLVTGVNNFFANGILVEGLTEEDMVKNAEFSPISEETDLEELTIAELKNMADYRGLTYKSRPKKAELIALLREE